LRSCDRPRLRARATTASCAARGAARATGRCCHDAARPSRSRGAGDWRCARSSPSRGRIHARHAEHPTRAAHAGLRVAARR